MGFFDKIATSVKKGVGSIVKNVGRTMGDKLIHKGIDFISRSDNPWVKGIGKIGGDIYSGI